ncbi:MAG TPA: folylpolyglutamate synthase/dihydrofolate synthase family protein [Pyrinomonadaceae bacterium]|nr:folylpolyglutamate synthase/dihydrofolate synthase family protein [Pyrinomonadaceae bacterium]
MSLMDFEGSVNYLYSLGNEVETMKLGLDNVRRLLAELGNPHKDYLKVQVAGTNGKGSVCAFLDSICRKAGIRAGLYTSPHLISVTERIRIDGVEISEDEFARLATQVRTASEDLVAAGEIGNIPTFFEQVTAIALLAFAEAMVELAILETGLGGRLDATTAAAAEIAAITRIDLDHQEYLGDTIEEIAAEKAAIITPETQDVILGMQSRAVMRQLRKHCAEFGLDPLNDEYEPWRILANDDGTAIVILSLYQHPPITLGLRGRHQTENAQTAVQIAKALLYDGLFLNFKDGEEEFRIVKGLEKAQHPGRLEYVDNFLLDGAHNIGGAKALRDYLDEFEKRPITLIFGAMVDKDVAEIAKILWPRAERVILTRSSNSRAYSAEALRRFLPDAVEPANVYTIESVDEAVLLAEKITPSDSIILVTGSLYLVGEVRKIALSCQP